MVAGSLSLFLFSNHLTCFQEVLGFNMLGSTFIKGWIFTLSPLSMQHRYLKVRALFLLLVTAHVLHAIEEYAGKLWDVYPPARYVCNALSGDPETGFVMINAMFVIISLVFWYLNFSRKRKNIKPAIWIWIVLQAINGTGHIAWSISRGAYTPGLVTSAILLIIDYQLIKLLAKTVAPNK